MVKPALFGLLACSLAWAWFNRALVVDAYDDPSSPVELQLDGIDLTVETTPLPPSPFDRVLADDTGRVPPALAYIEPEPAPSVAMSGGSASISGTIFGIGLRSQDDDIDPGVVPPSIGPTSTTIGPEPGGFDPDSKPPGTAGSTTVAPEPESSPLESGVVRLERHTTAGVGVLDLAVDDQGRWEADELPGGRYRIRAWIPGIATSGGSQVFFLAEGELSTHRIELFAIDPTPQLQLVDGGPMYVGLDSRVGVVASRQWIDDEGYSVTGPMAGVSVTLSVSGPLVLESSETAGTDSRGLASFGVRCTQPGATSGRAVMGDVTVSGPFPTCQSVPATVTPPSPPPTESSESPAPSSDADPAVAGATDDEDG